MIIMRFDHKPVPKARARSGRSGHYTPQATRYAESMIRAEAIEYMGVMAALEGPLEVVLLYFIEPPRSWSEAKKVNACNSWISKRPDVDNYAKLTLDALNGIVWNDDGQIAHLSVEKKYARKSHSIIFVKEV